MVSRGVTPEPERTQLLSIAHTFNMSKGELLAAVKAAHKAGGSVRDIAALSGRSTNTIQRWLREGTQ